MEKILERIKFNDAFELADEITALLKEHGDSFRDLIGPNGEIFAGFEVVGTTLTNGSKVADFRLFEDK